MSSTAQVTPVDPAGLAAAALRVVLPLLEGARAAGVVIRLAADGAVPTETAALADLVAEQAAAAGVGVLRVSAGDFLHRRSVRLEHGAADEDSAYRRWVDWRALRRDVLDPLADPDDLRWLPRLRDEHTDRSVRLARRPAAAGQLAIVDGPYLLRRELAGAVDVAVHLVTSGPALHRRFPADDDPRPGAWGRYLREADPTARADLVVRYDHPHRPALLG